MSGLSAVDLAAVGVLFVLAGMVKGAIGLGLPTISMGLMGIWLPIEQAAAILILPMFLTNVWQMLNGPALPTLVRRLWPKLTCLVTGTVLAAYFIVGTSGPSVIGSVVLGMMLIAYAILALWGVRFSVSSGAEPVLGPLSGLTTGLINGASAIFVIPAVPYLQALDLDKDSLIQALGMTAVIASVSLGFGLGINGALAPWVAVPGVIAVTAAFAGMAIGRVVRDRFSVETFRRWILIGVLGLGAAMVLRALY